MDTTRPARYKTGYGPGKTLGKVQCSKRKQNWIHYDTESIYINDGEGNTLETDID